MYQAYWGLGQSPFRANFDPRFYHQSPTQEEALARLHFLVEERRTLGLLLGEVGVGKSQLLDVFARQLGHVNRQTAVVNLVGCTAAEFLWRVATRLGAEVPAASSTFALGRALDDHIGANRYQQIATIVLLDDADRAQSEVLDLVLRLVQIDTARDARLTIVLAADPQRLHTLGSRLLDLVDLRIDLDGWEADDTAAFVKKALAAAGRTAPIFSDAALARLHELSGGIPRRVKQLADLALLAGAGGNLAHIEPETIESVFAELGIVTAEAPLSEAIRR